VLWQPGVFFSTGLYADIANRNKNLTSFDKSNINKLSEQNSNGSGSDGPFTASSIIEDGDNNLFTGQDVIDSLNNKLMIDGCTVYLLYTLLIFSIGFLIEVILLII